MIKSLTISWLLKETLILWSLLFFLLLLPQKKFIKSIKPTHKKNQHKFSMKQQKKFFQWRLLFLFSVRFFSCYCLLVELSSLTLKKTTITVSFLRFFSPPTSFSLSQELFLYNSILTIKLSVNVFFVVVVVCLFKLLINIPEHQTKH